MPILTARRSLRIVVRPLLGCALVASSALPADAQTAVRMGEAVQRRPFAIWSESAQSVRDSLVAVARAQIGTRYVFGGTTPKGFDCSGLVRYVMGALKVELPRTAAQQARIGDEVSADPSRLRPGDLLTFGRRGGRGVSHIGIYVGEGRYVHASSVAGRVIESDLSRTGSPLIKAWRGVRRIVAGAAEPDSVTNPNGAG
jgi:cell wall-associated NlpC family hydrolase